MSGAFGSASFGAAPFGGQAGLSYEVGFASQSGSALSVSAAKAISVGLAAQVSAPQPASANKGYSISLVLEAEFAVAVSAEKSALVGLVETTGAALPPDDNMFPAAPHNLTATPVSSSRVDLSWGNVIGASGYDIERDGVVVVEDHPSTSYEDTGLTAGTSYDYRVRAVA